MRDPRYAWKIQILDRKNKCAKVFTTILDILCRDNGQITFPSALDLWDKIPREIVDNIRAEHLPWVLNEMQHQHIRKMNDLHDALSVQIGIAERRHAEDVAEVEKLFRERG